MKVIAFDPFIEKADLELEFFDGQKLNFDIKTVSKEFKVTEKQLMKYFESEMLSI